MAAAVLVLGASLACAAGGRGGGCCHRDPAASGKGPTRSRGSEYWASHCLAGLFGVAVALGTLGRVWAGPSVTPLAPRYLGGGGGGGQLRLVNNLPAASLLAARTPEHPFALLIGLNLGPNLFVTGSLAWVLWLRAAKSAGARPSVAKASRIGVLAVPLSMIAALGVLVATGIK